MENNRYAEIINVWNKGKTIQYKNGENWDEENETCYAPFENVKTVEISSIF